jgi:hypothetical protein
MKNFKKGDRVRFSELAIQRSVIGRGRRDAVGVVAANQFRQKDTVSIQWPHRKTADRWHEDFVELVDPAASETVQ